MEKILQAYLVHGFYLTTINLDIYIKAIIETKNSDLITNVVYRREHVPDTKQHNLGFK